MGALNLKNATIALLVPFPSIAFFLFFIHHYRAHSDAAAANAVFSWCYNHPFLLANLLFFFNVNVLFWIIGLVQSNNWMIDLYWTVIPVMLVHYYASHPMAVKDGLRSAVVIGLTWVWSVRLTHNYFRREKWQWGEREDWRFNEMRRQYGKQWWWVSFFAVYVSQQIFLIGICLPMYAIHMSDKPWDRWDFFATVACTIGIVIAYYADTQLHDFVQRNERLKGLRAPTVPNLDKGLWRYSRHPNYFGEQLWWWSLAGFAWNLGQGWMLIGTFINTLCLAYVTVLVEKRMLNQQHRAEAYSRYQKSTSVWIPWFRSAIKDSKAKTS